MLKDKGILETAITVKKIRNGIELENNLVNAQRWAQVLRMRLSCAVCCNSQGSYNMESLLFTYALILFLNIIFVYKIQDGQIPYNKVLTVAVT